MNDSDTFNQAFSDYHNYKIWFFWGLGIFFRALNVFGIGMLLNNKWEQRKIKEFMNQ